MSNSWFILLNSLYSRPVKNNNTLKEVLRKSLFGIQDFTFVLAIYTFSIGVLSLATPITVQSLVNTFALSTDLKPLFNLTLILLVLLIFFGIIKSFQYLTVELLQQKLIAQLSVTLSKKVIFGPRLEFQEHNIRDKVNRFFEIISVQKLVALLVTDGLSVLIQTIIGLILLSLYHPYFIPFNLILIGTVIFVCRYFNAKAKATSVEESTAKFSVARFIQDIAFTESRLQNEEISFKFAKQSDFLITDYILSRKKHFKVLFIQNIIFLILYAVINAVLLGIGGYLIAIGQLSVGQLVAAEIIVNGISIQLVYGFKHLQIVYDLYSSCDKLNWFIDLKEISLACENEEFRKIRNKNNLKFEFKKVSIGFNRKIESNFVIEPAMHYELQYYDSRIKEQVIGLILKNEDLQGGDISVGGISYKDLSSLEVRTIVHNIDESVIFDGTIRENLLDFEQNLDSSYVYDVLRKFDLDERIVEFPNRLDERIHYASKLLSRSQKYRLNLARIYIHNPKLLMIQTTKELFSHSFFNKYLKVFMDDGCAVLSFIHNESIDDPFEFRDVTNV